MSTEKRVQRPRAVTAAVVLMYVGGLVQIAFGVLTIFVRYAPEAQSVKLPLPVALLGAGIILFGLMMIGLASAVSRGSSAARLAVSAILVLGWLWAVMDLTLVGDGNWSAVLTQGIAAVAILACLWVGRGGRYFKTH